MQDSWRWLQLKGHDDGPASKVANSDFFRHSGHGCSQVFVGWLHCNRSERSRDSEAKTAKHSQQTCEWVCAATAWRWITNPRWGGKRDITKSLERRCFSCAAWSTKSTLGSSLDKVYEEGSRLSEMNNLLQGWRYRLLIVAGTKVQLGTVRSSRSDFPFMPHASQRWS